MKDFSISNIASKGFYMITPIEIGIFGAPVNNNNLGCQALTYSIINLLEAASKDLNIQFHYNIFEWDPNQELDRIFCNRLKLNSSKLLSVRLGNYRGLLRKIKHCVDNRNMKLVIKNCTLVIDLTEGDSFADIYGQDRYDTLTLIKEMVEQSAPLILGSQTYGPFSKTKNRKRAAKVIQKAIAVIARDKISADYVKKISGVKPFLSCDLAFRLPYDNRSAERTGKKVGLNVSGLLYSTGSEGQGTDKSFVLKTDYDQYVDQIIKYLIKNEYEVHLIGHVEADYDVNKKLKMKYPSVNLAPEFDNPMDAKSYISSMDLFIGSRMHATIAALTSNTPVVPVAYSRKFTGLFENVDYPYVVDLQTEDTNETVQAVIDRIENYDETRIATDKSYQIAMRENDDCLKLYEEVIKQIIHA